MFYFTATNLLNKKNLFLFCIVDDKSLNILCVFVVFHLTSTSGEDPETFPPDPAQLKIKPGSGSGSDLNSK